MNTICSLLNPTTTPCNPPQALTPAPSADPLNNRISGAAAPRIFIPHTNDNSDSSALRTNTPDDNQTPGPANAAPDRNASDEQRLETILQNWLNDPQAKGDKKTAANRIKEAHQTDSAILDLAYLNLTAIPSEALSFLSGIAHLDLSHNQISRLLIPQGSLPRLRVLNLMYNQLSEFPEGAYPQLEFAYLSHNQISHFLIPRNSLPRLKSLNLDYNRLLTFPENVYPELEMLDLNHNQISSLSLSPASYSKLNRVIVDNNPNLNSLPIALSSASELTHISFKNTQIPEEQVNAILIAARDLRNSQTEGRLPQQLDLWASYANLPPKKKDNLSNSILKFSPKEQNEISEWLRGLGETSAFNTNQKGLAATVCSILKDAGTNAPFKDQLVVLARENNTACGDRAAMGLNQIYVSWKTMCVDQTLPLKKKWKIILGAAKTAALRLALTQEIHKAGKQGRSLEESAEIYLYYEHTLAKKLRLVTAVQSMLHSDIGKRSWINKKDLEQAVEANYLSQAIYLPAFDALIQDDPEAKKELDQIDAKIRSEMEEIDSLTTENEKLIRSKELQNQREAEQAKVKQAWLIKNLPEKTKYKWLPCVPILLKLTGSLKKITQRFARRPL